MIRARAIAAACLALLTCGGMAGAAPEADSRIISTLAGDGRPGSRDGSATSAEFYAPYGIAAAADGSLIVADAAGQRIRRIAPGGDVSTVAGGGEAEPSGLQVRGGYGDGDARTARFDRPTGVAFGPGGAIYVADSLNRCIRKIENGKVTTFAGAPGDAQRIDGPRERARFANPHGITFDGDGVAYVADMGAGIRAIARDGTVSTLPVPSGFPPSFSGVAATGSGADMTLYATDMLNVGVYRARTKTWTIAYSSAGGNAFGAPVAIAAIDGDYAVFTDTLTQNVRLLRAPTDRFPAFTRIVAGGTQQDPAEVTGFRDGPASQSEFFAPSGVAIRGSQALVADAGNRRIRIVPLPSLRGPVRDPSDIVTSSRYYRIALVSNIFGIGPELWSQSIGGVLEDELNGARTASGLTRDARVSVISLDVGSTSDMLAYARAHLAGQVDLVIFELNVLHPNRDIAADPALGAGDAWVGEVASNLRNAEQSLRASQTAFLAVVQPLPFDSSPLEGVYARLMTDSPGVSYADWNHNAGLLERAAIESGVPVLDALPAVHQYEAGARRRPLGLGNDDYLSSEGNRFMGEAISRELIRTRPWAARAGSLQGRDFSR